MPSLEIERYHLSQYDKPYESTVALASFIRSVLGAPALNGRVLDVGCGAGANIHWLDAWGLTKDCEVTGVDEDAGLLLIAHDRNPDRSFLRASFLDPLPPCEAALSIQTLSFIEDWRPALRELLGAAKQWLFVSSLFWDGVETHTHASDDDKVNAHYNVIDQRAFDKAARRWGATALSWMRFKPQQPLHASHAMLRSRTDQGYTFSGPLLMPWAFVAVRKG